MNPTLKFVFIFFLALLFTDGNAKCRRKFKLTDEFCANVPTTEVDVHAFAGTWFQIFLTTGTDPNQINKCTTAKYELNKADNTIEGLNCEFENTLSRPRCLRIKISKRDGGGPGSFVVMAGPNSADLNIVAFLGSKSFEYFAAAFFQCSEGDNRRPQYFILARKPFLQNKVLKMLKKKLRCLGFPLPKRRDFRMTQVEGCKYFFNKDGFDVLNPGGIM